MVLGDVYMIGMMALAIIGAGAGVWWRIHLRIELVEREARLDREATRRELAEFRLEAASKYATTNAIREVEERVVDAINRLGDRFDRYFEGQGRSAPRTRSK